MNRRCRMVLPVLAALLLVAHGVAPAQQIDEDESRGADPVVRERLDTIGAHLVELRFEAALASIEALIGEPGLSPADLAEAQVLRVQAHVAIGDLKAAEDDFREILRLRPGYSPDPTLTPRKAMDRFRKVQSAMIGRLRVELDPPDARFAIDGHAQAVDPERAIPLLATEHVLRAEREGFDPEERTVVIAADKDVAVELSLIPNARTVVVATDTDAVEVRVDGVSMGRTARTDDSYSARRRPAVLILENLPLGPHLFELRRACFRDEHFEEILTVDLLDRGPLWMSLKRMVPARAQLALEGGPAGAQVLVDEERIGTLPLEPFPVCPGSRDIEVRLGDRTVWRSAESMAEGDAAPISVVPRPNAVLLGSDNWPARIRGLAGQLNVTRRPTLPRSRDLLTARGWSGVRLPPNTDLAVAVLPAERAGQRERWVVYSPILDTLVLDDPLLAGVERPTWSVGVWGFATADSDWGGVARVVQVVRNGAAERAGLKVGDRVKTVNGLAFDTTASLMVSLGDARVEGRAELGLISLDGTARAVTLSAVLSPELREGAASPGLAAWRAAWGRVDAIASDRHAAIAGSNLALLLSEFGRHEPAVEAWRRVRWETRSGIGDGTVQYYLGRDLELAGDERGAVAAYRRAASSRATAFDDEGPAVAPAAADRLADLGVAVEPTAR